MKKLIFILLLAISPLISEAQSTWYQVADKNLSFSSIIANFSVTTVSGNPYQVNLGGIIYTFNSGQDVMFAYPNNVGQLPISFLSYSDINSISLFSNLTFNLDSLSKLSNLVFFSSNTHCVNTGYIGNNLPSKLTNFSSSSLSSTVTGTIDSLPPNMTTFLMTGGATMNGTIDSLPATIRSITITALGGIITGNFDSLKSKNIITTIQLYSANSIGGNVNSLTNINGLVFTGSPSCYINLDSLPSSVDHIQLRGNAGNFTGSINNLPTNMTSFNIGSWNGVLDSVVLNDLPSNIILFSCTSTAKTASYTMGRHWANNMFYFYANTLPLTSTEVDNLLIDLSNTTWQINSILNISGSAAPRTSASNAAVSKLQSMGVTVTTN